MEISDIIFSLFQLQVKTFVSFSLKTSVERVTVTKNSCHFQ